MASPSRQLLMQFARQTAVPIVVALSLEKQREVISRVNLLAACYLLFVAFTRRNFMMDSIKLPLKAYHILVNIQQSGMPKQLR